MPTARIEGISDAMRALDESPAEMCKAVRKALRKVCTEEARKLKSGVPSSAKELVKTSVRTLKSGDISGLFGLFMDKDRIDESGRTGIRWYHYYWKNYGTLTGRDPGHRFTTPIKHPSTRAAKRRRNNVGEMYTEFYETAIRGFDSRALTTFVKEMNDMGYPLEE